MITIRNLGWRYCLISSYCKTSFNISCANYSNKMHRGNIFDKILYSSYLDNPTELRFKQLNFFGEKKQQDMAEKISHNFPSILNYLEDQSECNRAIYNQIYQAVPLLSKKDKDHNNKMEPLLHWMSDYEYYDEIQDQNNPSGTPDPTIPNSTETCGGCGAYFHCSNEKLPGYLPSELLKNRTAVQLKQMICQRCHFMSTYDAAIEVDYHPDDFIKIVETIKHKYALVILLVDLLDFPISLWSGFQDILGNRRPYILVGNKFDLLPSSAQKRPALIKEALLRSSKQSGFLVNADRISLVSAKTGYGIEHLVSKLHEIWAYKGDVYIVGCSNVGKSSLFNQLLSSDYCNEAASNLIKRATTCMWPGTTTNMLKFPILRPSEERVFMRRERLKFEGLQNDGNIQKCAGKTIFKPVSNTQDIFSTPTGSYPIQHFSERDIRYKEARWCYDTPGIMLPALNILNKDEISKVLPKTRVEPRAFILRADMSLFLGGICRLDMIGDNDLARLVVYASDCLPLLISLTENADSVYESFLRFKLLEVPYDDSRFCSWPKMKSSDAIVVGANKDDLTCDIMLFSTGWIAVSVLPGNTATLRVWAPADCPVLQRRPALVTSSKTRATRI